jgi:hypothetical protein
MTNIMEVKNKMIILNSEILKQCLPLELLYKIH